MNFGMNAEATQRADDMIAAIDRLTAAVEANTAAIETSNALADCQLNGPRG